MTERFTAAVETLVHIARATHLCPEISWGVVVDGQLVAHGDTPDRVFRIASMTKSFTAAAVLSLRDEGLLSLDVPVAEYAPKLATVRGPEGSAAITLRHLLSMTSGLATDDPWADRHLDIDEAGVDEVYAAGPLFARRPGDGFEYSNLGYGIIGRVVRRVTGRPVQQHVIERLLEPLGMTSTTWVQPTHDDWARPHRVRDDESIPDPDPVLGDGEIAPMGGLWTTVSDLARWVSWLDDAVARPGAVDGSALCAASRREMQRQHTDAGIAELAGRVGHAGYGFGLLLRDDPVAGRIVGHSGGLPGYGSNMRWCSGRGVGAIALANTTYAPMSELTMRMLYAVHEAGALPPPLLPDTDVVDDVAQRLVRLLDDWSDAAADELFADNVALDEPYDRRAAAERRRIAEHGRLTVREVLPSTAAAATVRAVAADGVRVTIAFQLAPLASSLVQKYTVTLDNRDLEQK